MKNYDYKHEFNKRKGREDHKEQKSQGFRCSHCKQHVFINEYMGTMHRNHCNICLWSKHVDRIKPGDRLENCHAGMKPIGLTFKNEGIDRYGNQKQGEIMIIHRCVIDGRLSPNRIAADDDTNEFFRVLKESSYINGEIQQQLTDNKLYLLDQNDKDQIHDQLFGK